MRSINHALCISKSGKSAILKIEVDDRFGKKTINFSSVKGWRKDLALKHLSFESKEWDDNIVRVYIGIEVLKCSKDREEALDYINVIKSLSKIEVHFWSNKFLTTDRTRMGWRSFYGKQYH